VYGFLQIVCFLCASDEVKEKIVAPMVAKLKKERCLLKVPDTLLVHSMRSIIKNHTHFLGRAENPFQNLRELDIHIFPRYFVVNFKK